MKYVRLTDGRVKRWMQFQRTITATWARAIREQLPAQQVFSDLSTQIKALDITVSCKADLHARNWGARDLTGAMHAEWCLYLDGKRLASSAECPRDRYNDLRGRFEYRGTGKPYYTGEQPSLLNTRKEDYE
jgi:hypothetical protein